MKLSQIKIMLQNVLSQFNSVTTDKGTLVFDDDLKEGVTVMIRDEEGNETPAPDDSYYLGDEDGRTVVVEGGIIKEIITNIQEVEDTPAETEAEEETPEETPAETEDTPEEIAEEVAEVVEEVAEVVEETPATDETEELRTRIAELEALVDELNAKIKELEGEPAEMSAKEKYKRQYKTTTNEGINNLMRFAKK